MCSAESSYQQSLLQRVSAPLFLVLSLLLVFVGTSVSVFAAMIMCVIAGVENSDLQARIGLAATLIGFVGSIYLLIRARRFPPSPQQQSRTTASAPPPLPIAHTQDDIRRSNEFAGGDEHEATAEPDSEDIKDDADQMPVESNRIVDWLKVCTTPVLIAFNAAIIFVALAATLSPTFGMIGFVVVPIAFVSALTSHLMGTHFNKPGDRLSYPYFAWRLGLPLSGIHDANAQTINKRGVDVLASLGEKNPKYKTVHHYHVNLSGDFGARRLMFRSKFKRDQFLSILRTIRPDVRTTRWS
ncbi:MULTISPECIES: hypothetical protein [unclassified Bradyrhizobium]|uniref:hypothetical protein n=1 Tax=unclassified Bradyrhizobium TaxID=2631580 RepID=UPI002916F570|nr:MULTISPECIES: hypothetical protein [unclassified Bradyrhizobium]